LPSGGYDKLLKVFLPASLPQEPYPVLIPKGETVPTIASGAVLAVYNWPENSDRYRRVANFVKVFFDKFDKFLDPSRHPKWKEINLAGTVPQWRRFKAAQDWLDQQKYSAGGTDAMKVAFEQFLERQPAGSRDLSQQQRDKLFKDFVSWWQTQDRPPR
jgi:hypothetical protein